MSPISLQEQYAPQNKCFGCGHSNEQGLRIRSFATGDSAEAEVVAEFTSEPHHEAFEGVLNGGIIGTLLDCHMNWAAAFHLMELTCADAPPCTVTAEYSVKMKKPTPTDGPISLTAWVTKSNPDRAKIAAQIEVGGVITAKGEGEFVAVKEGHPAFHRW